MRELLLGLSVLLAADTAYGQLVRLTPEVATNILGMAEKARAEAYGDSGAAVREFRTAFRAKYRAWGNCNLPRPAPSLSFPPSAVFGDEAAADRRPAHCDYSPTAWYAEQLLGALASEGDLAAIEPIDAFVVMLAPRGAIRGTKQTAAIRQGEVVNQEVKFENSKTITPFRQVQKPMEFEERSGEVTRRTAWLFFFNLDLLDMSKDTEITWWLDEQTHGTSGMSQGVMKNMR